MPPRRASGAGSDEYVGFLVDWQRPLAGKKTLMDLVTRPSTFLWLIAGTGTLLVVAGRMDPVDLLPFLLLGTTFGARLLNIAYGLGGIRAGLLAARRLQIALDEPELCRARTSRGKRPRDASATVVFDHVDFGYRPGVPVIHGRLADAARRHGDRAGRPVRIRQVDTGRAPGSLLRRAAGRDNR